MKTSPTPRVKRFPDKTRDIQRSYGHSLVTHPLWTNSGSSFLVLSRVSQNMHSGSSVGRTEQECPQSAKCKKRDMETYGCAPWLADVWCQATVTIYITAHNSLLRWQLRWHCVTSNWWHRILELSIPNWSSTNASDSRMCLVRDTFFGLVFPVNPPPPPHPHTPQKKARILYAIADRNISVSAAGYLHNVHNMTLHVRWCI